MKDWGASCQAVLLPDSVRPWLLSELSDYQRTNCHNYDHNFHACFSACYVFFENPHFPLFLHRPLIPLTCPNGFLFTLVLHNTCQETGMKFQGRISCMSLSTVSATLRKVTSSSRYPVTECQTVTTSF